MPIRSENFDRDLTAFTEELLADTRKVIVTLDQAIVSGTPVDKGRLRANWFMDFGVVSAELTDSLAVPDTTRGNAWNIGDGNIFIHNSVEYAVVIDAGRGFRDGQVRGSDDAPQGIVDPAIASVMARFG